MNRPGLAGTGREHQRALTLARAKAYEDLLDFFDGLLKAANPQFAQLGEMEKMVVRTRFAHRASEEAKKSLLNGDTVATLLVVRKLVAEAFDAQQPVA